MVRTASFSYSDQEESWSWTATKVIGEKPDYISPGGASEIRELIQRPQGELTHATCPSGRISHPAALDGLYEMFFVLAGKGQVWRSGGGYEGVTRLHPGRWVAMPPGTAFQYRAEADADLVFLVMVVPGGRRSDTGHSTTAAGPWMARRRRTSFSTLPRRRGSRIRCQQWLTISLLTARRSGYFPHDPDGSVAHCLLPAGRTSACVRHRKVTEIWFVTGGHGALWRKPASGDGWEVPLRYGVCVDIDAGEAFQFCSTGIEPLSMVILTMPSWPGSDEAQPAAGDGRWGLAAKRPFDVSHRRPRHSEAGSITSGGTRTAVDLSPLTGLAGVRWRSVRRNRLTLSVPRIRNC